MWWRKVHSGSLVKTNWLDAMRYWNICICFYSQRFRVPRFYLCGAKIYSKTCIVLLTLRLLYAVSAHSAFGQPSQLMDPFTFQSHGWSPKPRLPNMARIFIGLRTLQCSAVLERYRCRTTKSLGCSRLRIKFHVINTGIIGRSIDNLPYID